MTKLIVQPTAELDFLEAVEWYSNRSREIGLAFESAVRGAFERIAASPTSWPALTRRHRFHLLERFPYVVVYRIRSEAVDVVAIAHTSRNSYLRKR